MMNSKIHPCYDVLRDVYQDLVEDYSRKWDDFDKFALSGKEPFILFLQVCQSTESITLSSDFLDVLLVSLKQYLYIKFRFLQSNKSFFTITLPARFDYFSYIIGRYTKSLDVINFPTTTHSFFKGLLDNKGTL